MTKKYNITLIYFLSIFALYISFFYFGNKQYFHPNYGLKEIIKSGFIVSIILGLPILLINFFLDNKYFLTNLIKSLILGVIFYLIFHLTVRFADYNLFYIFSDLFNNNNFYLKILFYSSPFTISFFIFIFSNDNRILNFIKFVLIYLVIINILSFFRLYEIYNQKNILNLVNKNDFKLYVENTDSNIDYETKKVFFLIFDEFDQIFFKNKIERFENLKKIYESSFTHESFYTPAMFTIDSIPAILTGNSTKRTIFKKGQLFIENLDGNLIKFEFKNSIFSQPKIKNFTSSIYGTYHPYCHLFKVKYCYDTYKHSLQKINLQDSLWIVFNRIYLDRLINVNEIFKKIFKNSNYYNRQNKLNDINSSTFLDNLHSFMFFNSQKFISKNNTNLIFMHFGYPHPPLKTQGLIKFNEEDSKSLTDYEKNLFMVEKTISDLITEIEKFNNSLLIISTDHWFKERKIGNKAYPAVFFSKIMNDDTRHYNDVTNNGSSIKKLIDLYFNNKILNNEDIKKFFDKEKNHDAYIR